MASPATAAVPPRQPGCLDVLVQLADCPGTQSVEQVGVGVSIRQDDDGRRWACAHEGAHGGEAAARKVRINRTGCGSRSRAALRP